MMSQWSNHFLRARWQALNRLKVVGSERERVVYDLDVPSRRVVS